MEHEESELDAYRNQVVEKLQYNYAHGELDEHEFEELLSLAIYATSKQALVPIETTLIPIPGQTDSTDTVPRKAEGSIVTIFGGVERKGRWNVPRAIKILTVFGGAEINLTQCALGSVETRIEILCIMGGVEIIVPDNAAVEASAVPIFGGIDDSTHGHNDNGPRIRISGFILFGGIEVRYMNKKERKRLQQGR